jgi:phage shock protein E
MNTLTWIIMAGIIVFFVLKRISLLRPVAARQWLSEGAVVIDVRTEGEFRQGHVAGAINIPLDRLRDEIGRHAPNHEQPLLLHCLTGTRSGIGRSVLRRMGYGKVFNLGSYSRAARILEGCASSPSGARST